MLGREEKVSQLRLTAVQYILLGIFLVLAFGLWRLQVARSDYYSTLAEQNRIKQVPILAPRGKILDREGRIIVDNYPSFSVLLLRDQKRNLDADADKIAAGLHMPPDELRARLKRMAAVPGYQPLFLKDDITPDELAFIESHRAELPELDIITVHRRLYPQERIHGARHRLCRPGQRRHADTSRNGSSTIPATSSACRASSSITTIF